MRRLREALALSAWDLALTAAVLAWALAEAMALSGPVPIGWRVTFALAVGLPLAWRGRAPLPVLAFAVAVFAFDLVAQPLPLQAVTPLQLLPVATYAAMARGAGGERARLLGAGSALLPAALYLVLVDDAPVRLTDVISLVVVQSVAAVAGWAVAQRRAEAGRRREALRRAEASADARVQAGTELERLRLARELRALVAITLAAMRDRLEGASRAPDLMAAAEGVQRLAAEAMAELRQLLGVLHEREEIVELATVGSAIDAARTRGWPIALATPEPEFGLVTPGAELAAGRLVEELLAGEAPRDARMTVHVKTQDGGLLVRIAGRGAPPPVLGDRAARGSLEERARLHGGRLGVLRLRRRWWLRAELPGVHATQAAAAWRANVAGDLVVVGGAALVVLGDALAAPRPWAMALVGTAWFVLPLALRRRAPLLVPAGIGSGLVLCQAAGLYGASSPGPLVLALLAVGSIAMRAPSRPQAVLEVGLVLVPAVAVNWVQQAPGEPPTDTPIIAFLAAMAYAFGRLVREHQARAADAASGAARLEVEVDQRLAAALDDERRAVARDLHDVVAHSVSLVSVLAGAVAAQAPRDPAAAERSLSSAREAIGQAEAELGRLTVALAIGGGPELVAPPAGDLEALIDDARTGGQRVDAAIDRRGVAGLPPVVAATAYRVLQEALTNARKHAPGALVEVDVAVEPAGLALTVTSGPAAGSAAAAPIGGSGRGLAGMAERVRLLGGELTAGPTAGGGFAVRASVPTTPSRSTVPV